MKKGLTIFLILFLCFPLILPFLHQGFLVTHDGEWAIIRLSAFHFALRDGQLPPRWAGNLFHTYGYPVLNFNYPLPPMLGEVFHLLGFNFVNSVKAVFTLSIIFSGIFFYLFINEIFKNKTLALLGTIFYLYYPFRLVDLYVRGSVGESLIFAILPLIYWSLIKLKKRKNRRWLVMAGLSIALLILGHNSLALVSLPFVFFFMVFNLIFEKNDKKSLLHFYFVALLIGFSLSAFFWLPALYEKQWTNLSPEIITKPTNHFPTLRQLIIPSWSYGQSKAPDSLSFQLGPIHFIFAFGALLFLFLKKYNPWVFFFTFVLLINLFFLLPISKFFWENLPLLAFVSYPWRLLVPIGFYLSIIACYPFVALNKKLKFLAIFIVFLILFSMTKDYRKPLAYINKDDMYYITNQSTTIEGDENTPVWVKNPPKQAPIEKIIVDGEYKIIKQKSNLLEFWTKTDKIQKITVNTIYYPGWELFINNKKDKIDFNNQEGLITFLAPAGQNDIKLVFQETSLRLITDIISVVSFIIFLKLLFL